MRSAAASIALMALALPAAAQGLKSYLPAASATKASSYLAAIDAANSGIRSKRAAARAAQLQSESAALEAFALLYAADGGDEWADADGSMTSASAATAFAEARARALGAAASLSSGGASEAGTGTADLEKKRDESADKLAALIKESKLGSKSAAAVEKFLSDRIKNLGAVFPEIVEVQSYLRKAGVPGCLISAAAMCGGSPELAAAAYVESADEILAAAPAASRAMESLAASYAAYTSWISGFALASCPGSLASTRSEGPEPLSRGIAAIASLEAARASALVSAMEAGDGREASAASAARRLAAVWESLGASMRRELAAACGTTGSAMACFASAVSPRPARRDSGGPPDPATIMLSLNALASALADEETKGSRSGAEPALALLESPRLAAAAAAEPRYADLIGKCSARISAVYRKAAQDADEALEALPSVIKAASRALGSAPSSLVVETVDIGPAEAAFGRIVSFVATAKGPDGRIARLPIRSEIAADAYARSFAKASGLAGVAPQGGALKTLERYGQRTIAAYDPSRAGGRIALSSYPKDDSFTAISAVDLERELLEGWSP
jgi:hypothetical protein